MFCSFIADGGVAGHLEKLHEDGRGPNRAASLRTEKETTLDCRNDREPSPGDKPDPFISTEVTNDMTARCLRLVPHTHGRSSVMKLVAQIGGRDSSLDLVGTTWQSPSHSMNTLVHRMS